MTSTNNRAALLVAVLAAAMAAIIAIASTGVFANNAGAQEAEPEQTQVSPAEAGDIGDKTMIFLGDDDGDGFEHDEAYDKFEACIDDIWSELDGDAQNGDTELTDEQFDALDDRVETECVALLPADELAAMAEFEAFEECMDSNLDVSDEDITEAAIDAAAEACNDLLPAEWAELDAEFEAFEACLSDNGIEMFDEAPFGDDEWNASENMVIIVTADGEQIIDLGEDVASVTVDSDGTNVTVATSGDVEVVEIDWAAEEAAFESCEPLLPEGVMEHGPIFGDEIFDGELMFDGEMLDGPMFDVEMFELDS